VVAVHARNLNRTFAQLAASVSMCSNRTCGGAARRFYLTGFGATNPMTVPSPELPSVLAAALRLAPAQGEDSRLLLRTARTTGMRRADICVHRDERLLRSEFYFAKLVQ